MVLLVDQILDGVTPLPEEANGLEQLSGEEIGQILDGYRRERVLSKIEATLEGPKDLSPQDRCRVRGLIKGVFGMVEEDRVKNKGKN